MATNTLISPWDVKWQMRMGMPIWASFIFDSLLSTAFGWSEEFGNSARLAHISMSLKTLLHAEAYYISLCMVSVHVMAGRWICEHSTDKTIAALLYADDAGFPLSLQAFQVKAVTQFCTVPSSAFIKKGEHWNPYNLKSYEWSLETFSVFQMFFLN